MFSIRGSIVLPLHAAPGWRAGSRLTIAGMPLEAKSELHVTLLSRAQLASLAAAGVDPIRLERGIERFRFRFRWTRRLWLIHRPGTQGGESSLIRLLHQPDQQRLRRWLRRISGVDLGDPVPHVTLYTLGCPEGIGIPDRDTFRRLRRVRLSAAAIANLSFETVDRCPG